MTMNASLLAPTLPDGPLCISAAAARAPTTDAPPLNEAWRSASSHDAHAPVFTACRSRASSHEAQDPVFTMARMPRPLERDGTPLLQSRSPPIPKRAPVEKPVALSSSVTSDAYIRHLV